jgi:hypothetical protein
MVPRQNPLSRMQSSRAQFAVAPSGSTCFFSLKTCVRRGVRVRSGSAGGARRPAWRRERRDWRGTLTNRPLLHAREVPFLWPLADATDAQADRSSICLVHHFRTPAHNSLKGALVGLLHAPPIIPRTCNLHSAMHIAHVWVGR